MNRSRVLWILQAISFWILMMIQTAAALSASSLNCSVSQLHDGHFLYQLSQSPTSGKCDTCWEDQNKTVLARDSRFNPGIVQSVTDHSIVLINCHDYLRFTWECDGVAEETSCRVNCSLFITNVHKPSWFCFSSSLCLSELVGCLLIGLIALGFIIWFVWMKCKRRRSSNIPASPAELELIQQIQNNNSTEGGEKLNGAMV